MCRSLHSKTTSKTPPLIPFEYIYLLHAKQNDELFAKPLPVHYARNTRRLRNGLYSNTFPAKDSSSAWCALGHTKQKSLDPASSWPVYSRKETSHHSRYPSVLNREFLRGVSSQTYPVTHIFLVLCVCMCVVCPLPITVAVAKAKATVKCFMMVSPKFEDSFRCVNSKTSWVFFYFRRFVAWFGRFFGARRAKSITF